MDKEREKRFLERRKRSESLGEIEEYFKRKKESYGMRNEEDFSPYSKNKMMARSPMDKTDTDIQGDSKQVVSH
ncbi:hypothetical protein PUN28_010487 [Cardiocondyla obscurior]|uniref:Uncharacterized protein n=1 Tax=Cardiocondyla obscurior TaxID=286306 RepID=A0AAW2FG60_9HYME